MKPDIHPNYRFVVFRDLSANSMFLSRSTIRTRETIVYEGQEYPCVTVDISSESHPFFTGQQKLVDTEGRVERFNKKYGFGSTQG
jgi:large subunit ribosomal protein L31